ncbi:MAG TPA: GH92 family glycosyl hydrolase [Edaphobacter sp.]|nr:GH92 family glycosyl hydrolase [Edaphobacter sp.]
MASLLGPLGSTLPWFALASGTAHASSSPADTPQLLRLVNPLQGTNSTVEFSRGNTLPIVALPFGTAHWTLQSHDRPGWFFEPASNRLQGVRLTHQLSPWLGDYGYATLLPITGDPGPSPDSRASSYRPREMEITPVSLKLYLLRYLCTLELAPTERCCVMRLTFDDPANPGLLLDLPGDTAEASCDTTSGIVTALIHDNRGGVQSNFTTYLHFRLDRPITGFEIKQLKGHRIALIRFSAQDARPVEARISTSFISLDQARTNLDREVGSKPFHAVATEAASVWERALGRVRLQGRTELEHRTFYSCLYRTLLFPRMWHEQNVAGETVHRSPYTGNVEPGVLYADHGFWDDYHAWYPMMLLLYPERLRDILQSWVNAYKEGGWLPQFPCPGYRGAMTGSPSDILFGDAAAKGLTGFDLATAYEGLKKHASEPVRGFGFGRTALEPYLRLGYVSCDNKVAGVAETLDYVYGDFCIAQVARALGKPEDAAHFLERSRNWRKIFDPHTKFFRGKLANGEWVEPFDPFAWGGPYVEGGPWQYRFNVPHDPQGLFEAFGGKAGFVHELEAMFTQPPRFHVGAYGAEIHEMSEMAAVNFGQYDHGNQPGHNVLYLFTLAGRRDRTQHYAHRILKELYPPDDFPGDEDTGAMSAWYILSALGLFAVCPGDSKWTLGAPFFDTITVDYGNGRHLRIEAKRRDDAAFLDRVTLNGKPTDGIGIEHADLTNATLVFESS